MNSPYVYALVDRRSDVVFYIGKGRGRRMYQHIAEARRGKSGRKYDRIREILSSGMQCECLVLGEYLTDCEAYTAEKEFIAAHQDLTNENCGGGGRYPVSQEIQNQRHRDRACSML